MELNFYSNPLELLNLGETNPSKYYYILLGSYVLYKDYPYFYDSCLGASKKLKVISSKIMQLDVSNNKLQSLDVSECSALTTLSCTENPLEDIFVKKGQSIEISTDNMDVVKDVE